MVPIVALNVWAIEVVWAPAIAVVAFERSGLRGVLCPPSVDDEQRCDPEDRDGRGGSFSVGDPVGRGRRAGALAIGVLALSARATRWDLGAGWQARRCPAAGWWSRFRLSRLRVDDLPGSPARPVGRLAADAGCPQR